ncbi:MAG: cobalamin biosynthesis protein CbiX [Gammaproteobacteria bacterium]|nr:cobalamin biosynthesis protein CbiX [Gammaproteobacteria bacterium]
MNKKKKALLVAAHGSRKKVSNIEIHQLANNILLKSQVFDIVEACFLEIAKPSIPDGIKSCIEKNASEILIMPYFLAAGMHVIEDIPGIVDKERLKHKGVIIKSLPYFGSSPVIVDILKTLAENDT